MGAARKDWAQYPVLQQNVPMFGHYFFKLFILDTLFKNLFVLMFITNGSHLGHQMPKKSCPNI